MLTKHEFKEYYLNCYGTTLGWKQHWLEYKMNTISTDFKYGCVSLGCNTTLKGATANWIIIDDVPVKKQEEENSMIEKTEAAVQRDYLSCRLRDATYDKDNQLAEQFQMHSDPSPKTYKQLIDMIVNKKYTLDDKRIKKIDAAIEADNLYAIFGCFDGIVWNGGPDVDGYNAAIKAMHVEKQKVKDIIMGGVYADALKALQAFEAWTPVGNA